jgi:hypothetical protein
MMYAPYTPAEVGRALVDFSKRRGLVRQRFEVVADERSGRWIVLRIDASGPASRFTFPFASQTGIYTPAEIARQVVLGTWPFE